MNELESVVYNTLLMDIINAPYNYRLNRIYIASNFVDVVNSRISGGLDEDVCKPSPTFEIK
jgi:hypothetical protein